MARYGDQEQSSPGGARHPLEVSQIPVAPTPAEPARRESASAPDRQPGGEARLAEQDGARQVPHQRQAPSRRASLLRRPESLRAIPSLARFLTRAAPEPGDTRVTQDTMAQDPVAQDPVGQDRAARTGWPGTRSSRIRSSRIRRRAGRARPARAPRLTRRAGPAGASRSAAAPRRPRACRRAPLRSCESWPSSLTSSAELAGLVHDLGALIVGLMTAATGAGDRQARTFAIPPELAELAAGAPGAESRAAGAQRAVRGRWQPAGARRAARQPGGADRACHPCRLRGRGGGNPTRRRSHRVDHREGPPRRGSPGHSRENL